MKKLLSVILSLCFISIITASMPCFAAESLATWKITCDLGLNILRSTTDSESIYGKIDIGWKQDAVGLHLKNDLYREKVEDALIQYDKNTEMQIELYRASYYYFLNAADTRNYTLDIDEVDIGAGLGLETKSLKLQTGYFIKDKEVEREYFSITSGNLTLPLNDIFSFQEDAKYQVNTQKADDYSVYSDTAIVSKAMWLLSLAGGYKVTYKNMADNRMAERVYCNLRLSY